MGKKEPNPPPPDKLIRPEPPPAPPKKRFCQLSKIKEWLPGLIQPATHSKFAMFGIAVGIEQGPDESLEDFKERVRLRYKTMGVVRTHDRR